MNYALPNKMPMNVYETRIASNEHINELYFINFGKPSISYSTCYFGSRASNHMTNTINTLTNLTNYFSHIYPSSLLFLCLKKIMDSCLFPCFVGLFLDTPLFILRPFLEKKSFETYRPNTLSSYIFIFSCCHLFEIDEL